MNPKPASPVVIPAQIASKPLTSIGTLAFYNCTDLTSVTIPSSVTSIGYYAFHRCIGLEAIIVEAGNPQYASVGGVLFNATQTTLIQYPDGKPGAAYTIPPASPASEGLHSLAARA